MRSPGAVVAATITAFAFGGASIPLVLLGLNVWPAADDYTNWNTVARLVSPFDYALFRYAAWSGRVLFEFGAGIVFAHPELHRILTLIGPLAFAGTPLAAVLGWRKFAPTIGRTAALLGATIGLAALWFGMAPYLAECVFWLTGGLQYSTALVLGTLWLAAFFSVRTLGRRSLIVLGISGLILGTAHEQLSAALIIAVLMYAVLYRVRRGRLAAAVLPLALGTVVMYLAPGNFIRAASGGTQGLILSPVTLLANYVLVAQMLAGRLSGPMVSGAAAGAMFGLMLGSQRVPRGAALAWSLIMLTAAIGATAPLAAVPDFAGGNRAAFFPVAFALFAAAGFGIAAVPWLELRPPSLRLFGASAAVLLTAAYLLVALEQVHMALTVRPELEGRLDLLLHADHSADVVTPRLRVLPPNVVHTSEFSEDPSYWENRSAALYFGIRSVRGHLGETLAQ